MRPTVLAVAVLLAGCATRSAQTPDGHTGAAPEAAVAASTCDHTTMGTQACADMRAAVIAQAGARQSVIERALEWVDDGVAFDHGRFRQGYPTDCAGFVAMAWGESAPLGAGDVSVDPLAASSTLALLDDLEPGDALSHRDGHVFLFGGWTNEAHDGAIVLEQAHAGTSTMMSVSRSALERFTPIRSNHL